MKSFPQISYAKYGKLYSASDTKENEKE